MKEDSKMRNKVINRISIMLEVVLIFMLALNVFGQDRRGRYSFRFSEEHL